MPWASLHPLPISLFSVSSAWQIDGETIETVTDFIFLGSKITADCDYSQEIKRHLLLGRKAMTNLDSIFKSTDITLPTNYIYSSLTSVSASNFLGFISHCDFEKIFEHFCAFVFHLQNGFHDNMSPWCFYYNVQELSTG